MSIYAQWNPNTTYVVGDIVEFAGFNYIATAVNQNVSPFPISATWNPLPSGGGGGGGGVSSVLAGNSNIVIGGTLAIPTVSGTLTSLTSNVNTANFSFSGNSGSNPSFVVGAGQNFRVITTDLTPQIVVGASGVSFGDSGSGYTVNSITPAVGNNSTQVATTAFVHRSQVNTLNFFRPLFPTLVKQSIIYHNASTTINNTNIDAQLDNYTEFPQYLSYGVPVQPLYVIVGQGTVHSLAVSTDGTNYQGLGMIFSTWGNAVGYSGALNRWVAFGKGTTSMFYSNNGLQWTAVASSTTFFNEGYAVFWNGTRFLGGGLNTSTGNTLGYSADGITWVGQGNTIFTSLCNAFATNGEITVAVGKGGNDNAISWDNGLNWIAGGTVFGGGEMIGITWTGSRFIAVGDNASGHTMYYSYNGLQWTPQGLIFPDVGRSIVTNGNVIIAVGGYLNDIYASSDQGKTFTQVGAGIMDGLGFSVIWSGSLFIGAGSGTNHYGYSADGYTWYALGTDPIDTSIRGVAYNGDRSQRIQFPLNTVVVAGGTSNTISYSYNNANHFVNVGSSIFTTQAFGVAYGADKFVGIGQGGNTIGYSYNGKNWYGVGTAIFSTTGKGVVYSSVAGRWVAVGNGTNSIASSTDGITWTGQGTTIFTQGNSVAYGNGYFVSGGQGGSNTIAYSTTGTAFTGAGATVFTTACKAVSHNGTRFALGGSGGASLAYSNATGTSYTAVPSSTSIFTTCNGIAWNGTIFLATGSGANIFASSPDGITWTGLGGSVFTTGNGVVWIGNNKWLAFGSGTNTMAVSTDATGTGWIPLNGEFSSEGYGGAWNGVSGSAVIPSTSLTLNSTNNKKLDVVSAPYSNVSFTNITMTIKT
jgi:hypothetical protein